MTDSSCKTQTGDFPRFHTPYNPPPYYYYYYESPWITNPSPFPRDCHGCKGLGWIETTDGKPHVCPVCEGKGTVQDDGDYSITWNTCDLSGLVVSG